MSRRLEGLAAIGFAIAYFVAIVLTNVPDEGETVREAMDFYNDAGQKLKLLIAVYCMAAAALLFVVLVAVTAQRLRDVPRKAAVLAGTAFVALYLAAAAAFVAPTLTLSLDSTGANAVNRQFVNFARGMSTLGDALLLVCAPFAAAAFVAALAWAGGLPRWLAWSGYAVAAACLFGFAFFPLLLFALWIAALGVWMISDAGTDRA
jgi:uncharacterized membrane protein YhaH (DUF805 family)